MRRKNLFAATLCLGLLFNSVQSVGAYGVQTHSALTYHALLHPYGGTRAYLINELLINDGLSRQCTNLQDDGMVATKTLLDWARQGAIDEDRLATWRFFNHFYNPADSSGLGGNLPNSLEWAWQGSGNKFNWKAARDAYALWLSLGPQNKLPYAMPWPFPFEYNSDSAAAELFYALGHIAHLVQDLAQPQHTRSDPHGPNAVNKLYEEFVELAYGTQQATAQFAAPLLPHFTTLPPPDFTGVPPELAALWDTRQYRGQADFEPTGELGLAEYSHLHFVTDDTMFIGQQQAQFPQTTINLAPAGQTSPRHARPRLEQTDIAEILGPGIFTLERLGDLRFEPSLPGDRQISLVSGGERIDGLFTVNPATGKIFLTGANFQRHADKLLPKAIGYSTAVLDYFFRGKLEVLDQGTFVAGRRTPNDSGTLFHRIRITNRSPEPIVKGNWLLITDVSPGIRMGIADLIGMMAQFFPQEVLRGIYPEIDFSTIYQGRLEPGQSYTAYLAVGSVDKDGQTHDSLDLNGKLMTVIYQGTLGNEQDVAVIGKHFYVGR